MRALVFRRLLGGSIFDKFNAKHQTFATGVANYVMFSCQFAKSFQQIIADLKGVLLKTLAINHLKHSASLGTRQPDYHRKCLYECEKQVLARSGPGHNCGKRRTVADALRHCHDIRNYVVRFKSPIVRSGSSKTN